MKIYCDEAGHTGKNLMDENQEFFVYAGLNLEGDLPDQILDFVKSNYNYQGGEFKGKNLVKSSKGRKLIVQLFKEYGSLARIVFHDKKYALACKIIEYGIEPYLEGNNMLFYLTQLNKFLAYELYEQFTKSDLAAENIYKDFYMILTGDLTFDKSEMKKLVPTNSTIKWILDIVYTNPQLIIDEIGEFNRWVLDIVTTSMIGIFSDFSKNGEALDITCDESQFFNNPIIEYINNMGVKDSRTEILGINLGYKLKDNIKIENSKEVAGLQVADIFASSVFYALKNTNKEFSESILPLLPNSFCTPGTYCVLPENIDALNDNKVVHFLYTYLMRDIEKRVTKKYK